MSGPTRKLDTLEEFPIPDQCEAVAATNENSELKDQWEKRGFLPHWGMPHT